MAQHLKEVAIVHNNGIFAGKNDVVEKLTGRKPQTIKEFIFKGMLSMPLGQNPPS